MHGCGRRGIQEHDYFDGSGAVRLTAIGAMGSTCAAFATRSATRYEHDRSPRRIQ